MLYRFNTFGGNRIKLEAHGLDGDKVREVNFSGVKIAKEAVRSTDDRSLRDQSRYFSGFGSQFAGTTVSFMENGRLLTGYTPEMVAATLSGFPLSAASSR
jgi:hypothetical protein